MRLKSKLLLALFLPVSLARGLGKNSTLLPQANTKLLVFRDYNAKDLLGFILAPTSTIIP